jgi:hypothetical protein
MEKEEILYKEWRIDLWMQDSGWKALIYRPHSTLHEPTVPTGQNRRMVIEDAKSFIDGWLGPA